ncbi:MAG TPA: hypothetical protein VK255_04145 [Patescibacteria group bacterium]|nr:hypothetical protein [Patescibacteria group bacterium]
MSIQIKKTDGIVKKEKKIKSFDLPLSRFVQKYKKNSILISPQGKSSVFFTSDSGLYFSQNDLGKWRNGIEVTRATKKFDSLTGRNFQGIHYNSFGYQYSKKTDQAFEDISDRYTHLGQYIKDFFNNSVQGVTAVRMWNLSIVSSLIFGMFLMTMIYRYLGQGVSAGEKAIVISPTAREQILGEETSDDQKKLDELAERILTEQNEEIRKDAEKNTFEGRIRQMTKGYPIEKMASDIARQDKIVAAFLVSIAKKESDWGKHVPVLDGKDCYNYWGFRAQRERMGTGGHTCFSSRSDAVMSVARRIKNIIEKEKIKTPQGMVTVWKCGYDCSWDSPTAVKKWVSDVDGYFEEVNELKK